MESRSQVVATQLRALMDRHSISPRELAERSGVDAVTIRRILKATAKTEPSRERLRRISAAVGEAPQYAFPDDFTRDPSPDRNDLLDLAARLPPELHPKAIEKLEDLLDGYFAARGLAPAEPDATEVHEVRGPAGGRALLPGPAPAKASPPTSAKGERGGRGLRR